MLKLTPAWQFGLALKMFEKTFCHMSTGLSQALSDLIWSAGCWKGFSEIHHVIFKVSPSHQDTRIEEGACVGLMLMLKAGANFRSADVVASGILRIMVSMTGKMPLSKHGCTVFSYTMSCPLSKFLGPRLGKP